MFAPALFLPLGTILLSSQARRGIVGYLLLLLAVAFAALGVILLLTLPLRDAVTVLVGVLVDLVFGGCDYACRSEPETTSQPRSQELRTSKSSITR